VKPSKQKQIRQQKTISPINPDRSKTNIRILLAILAFVVYAQSINFEFTLDDDIFYQKHASVQRGFSGIGEFFTYGSMFKFDGTTGVQPYRPVTLLSFAADKVLTGNSAPASHFFNLLYYIILLQLLYSVLLKLLPGYHIALPAFMVLIYAAHPIHSEVVSSVKSRDELLAALFGFLSWRFFVSKNETTNYSKYVLSGFFFLAAVMSKESAIAFAALIPLSYFMLIDNNMKSLFIKTIPLAVGALVFLACRQYAMFNGTGTPHTMGIPKLDNVLAGADGFASLMATKMEVLFYYLKLLFVPCPLSWDYSFNQIPLVDWSSSLPWLGLILNAMLVFSAIYFFKRQAAISYAIIFYLIASLPINNLFFLNGATLAERFMFVPSLGFAICVPLVLSKLTKMDLTDYTGKSKQLFKFSLIGIVILFSGMSMARSGDWKNNFTLFESGAKNAPNSSRTNAALASEYMNKAQEETDPAIKNEQIMNSIKYYEKSLSIFPGNSDASYKVGLIYSMIGKPDESIKYYRQSLEATPGQIYALNNLGSLYASRKQYDSARYFFTNSILIDSTNEMTLTNLVVVHYLLKEYDEAINFGNKAIELQYRNGKIYSLLSQSWTAKGNLAMANKFAELEKQLLPIK